MINVPCLLTLVGELRVNVLHSNYTKETKPIFLLEKNYKDIDHVENDQWSSPCLHTEAEIGG